MACDICGVKGRELIPLLDSYRTPEIQDVCPACEKIINNKLKKVQHATAMITFSLMKRFMHVLRLQR